jgi:hypothetical protein
MSPKDATKTRYARFDRMPNCWATFAGATSLCVANMAPTF